MTTNIQSDSLAGGELAGDALAKAVGEKGTVLTIDNATGFVPSKARTDGFAAGDQVKYPEHQGAAGPVLGQRRGKAAIYRLSRPRRHNPDLVGVFGAETNNTQGALTGVREAGKQSRSRSSATTPPTRSSPPSRPGSCPAPSCSTRVVRACRASTPAVAAMQGKPVPRNQSADAIFVTPATVNTAEGAVSTSTT